MPDRDSPQGPPRPPGRGAAAPQAAIDDCWNRIGIRGDRSCAHLQEHVHCRNCPVHAAAAIAMLDRHEIAATGGFQEQRDLAEPDGASAREETAGRRILVFRLGGEWLGLSSACVLAVTPTAPVHRLPHQRAPAVLGLCNVRGMLAACLSLARFLSLPPAAAAVGQRRVVPMMLILDGAGGPLAVPVDEVEGIHPIPPQAIVDATRDSAHPIGRFADGVTLWRQRSVTILDDAALLPALAESLA